MDNRVTLTVDGMKYGGWTEVRVTRSIENVAGAFQVAVTERWPWNPSRRPIRRGQRVAVAIGGETVITGYVYAVRRDYDAETHRVAIGGRDATGDLVDCDLLPIGDIAPQKLEALVAMLAAPFKIPVRVEVDTGQPIEASPDPGNSVWDEIAEACRARAVLAISDGLGGIVLTRAGALGRVPDKLQLGRNVVRARGISSENERFSELHVFGQRPGIDEAPGDWTTDGHGVARDPTVRRYRPRVVIAERVDEDTGYQGRAEWELRYRVGRSERFEYEVKGWRHAGGALWQPNALVTVEDEFMGMSRELLIVSVELTLDEHSGSMATLTLTDRTAFDLLPVPLDGQFG